MRANRKAFYVAAALLAVAVGARMAPTARNFQWPDFLRPLAVVRIDVKGLEADAAKQAAAINRPDERSKVAAVFIDAAKDARGEGKDKPVADMSASIATKLRAALGDAGYLAWSDFRGWVTGELRAIKAAGHASDKAQGYAPALEAIGKGAAGGK